MQACHQGPSSWHGEPHILSKILLKLLGFSETWDLICFIMSVYDIFDVFAMPNDVPHPCISLAVVLFNLSRNISHFFTHLLGVSLNRHLFLC